ncbi:unnamed protein product [Fusarium fujikuroi]|nr:unnamed protein product [Fusarium fujikuroi]
MLLSRFQSNVSPVFGSQRLATLQFFKTPSHSSLVQKSRPFASQASQPRSHENKLSLIGGVSLVVTSFAVGAAFLEVQSTTTQQTQSPKYASHDEMLQAAEEITGFLGEDAVTYDAEVLEHHGHSDWSTANSCERAIAVAYPRSTEEVSTIARICSKYRVPMIPFGAGSSVEGNFAQPYSGLCIDMSYMDQVIAFHPEDMDIVVQPKSPHQDCSRQWIRLLPPLLEEWSRPIAPTRRRPRKTSAGFNLTSLFVGSEGTLGIVTEVTLKLTPIPEDTSVAVVSFPSIKAASAAASALMRSSGVQLAALEILDDVQMRVLNKHGSAVVKKRKWAEKPTLFLKFSGCAEAVRGDVKRVSQLIKPFTSDSFQVARTKQEEHDLWLARKEALFTMVSIRPPGTRLWSTDVAVPLSRLAEIIDVSKQDCSQLGIFASVVGHVGDGNFHVAMFYDPQDAEQSAKVGRAVKIMMRRALEMEGTVSGEHAIGIGKKECLMDELGPATIGLMQTLKKAVDPNWLMNPGKVFDPPSNLYV